MWEGTAVPGFVIKEEREEGGRDREEEVRNQHLSLNKARQLIDFKGTYVIL